MVHALGQKGRETGQGSIDHLEGAELALRGRLALLTPHAASSTDSACA